MIKTILTSTMILVATSIVAQDTLTPEQQAAKCAQGGGCAILTFDEFMAIVQAEKAISYKRGLQACNSNI